MCGERTVNMKLSVTNNTGNGINLSNNQSGDGFSFGDLFKTAIGGPNSWPYSQKWVNPYDFELEFPFTSTSTISSYYNTVTFTDGKGFIELDIPGVPKDKVDVTIENGYIKVVSERKGLKNTYEFSFNQEIDADKTEANLVDGVLRVTLYAVAPKSKKVLIK